MRNKCFYGLVAGLALLSANAAEPVEDKRETTEADAALLEFLGTLDEAADDWNEFLDMTAEAPEELLEVAYE